MELLEEQRETWGTRGGFVLAAVGSAVGLGNLWGFPYKLYSYGGGAFLIPYIIAMFCIGVPMLILEFSLGHFTQRAAPNAFARCNKKLEFVGWWGVILGFVIITYYPTILAYCLSFMWYSIESIVRDTPLPWAGEGVEGVENAKNFFYDTYLGYHKDSALGGFQWHIFGMLLGAWVLMYFCIFRGVKLVGKIVWITVPLPFLVLVVLTVRGLTLPGSMEGLVYYLDPTWSELAKPTTWRFAFGQVFFSLSLAFGVMVTYASFLHRKSDINNNASIIALSDFATSFIGGLAIFATLGGMAYASQQAGSSIGVGDVVAKGPGLAFVAFPYALAQLPGAAWWSLIFFFMLITLGIDSAFSITESVLAGIVDKTGWKRGIVLPVMSLVGLGSGLVFVTQGGLNWLGTVDDFINGTWGIAFLGLLECVVLGWFYRVENLRQHANERSDWRLGKWWNFSIRVFIPVVLGTLFIWSLFDDFSNADGFIRTPEGEWILPNCVGLMIVGIAPVIAIFMSLMKNPNRQDSIVCEKTVSDKCTTQGRSASGVAFAVSVVSGVMIVWLAAAGMLEGLLLYAAFALGMSGLLVSNYVLNRYDHELVTPSKLARCAGIIATADVSACIAAVLIRLADSSAGAGVEEAAKSIPADKLGAVSYVILGVVTLVVFGGLGWCFYRAIAAFGSDEPVEEMK